MIVWADRRFQLGGGRVFALYVAGYTLGRGWIEMLRIDPANHIFGLRINVLTSIVVFLGAVVFLLVSDRQPGADSGRTRRAAGPGPPPAVDDPGIGRPERTPTGPTTPRSDEPDDADVRTPRRSRSRVPNHGMNCW